jgi:actin-related protein
MSELLIFSDDYHESAEDGGRGWIKDELDQFDQPDPLPASQQREVAPAIDTVRVTNNNREAFAKAVTAAIFRRSADEGVDRAGGLHHIVHAAIESLASPQVQELMYGNICLGGGNTMIRGLAVQLEAEIGALVQGKGKGKGKVKVKVSQCAGDASLLAWEGAAALARDDQLQPSQALRIERYNEEGPTLIHQHCDWYVE